MTNSAESFEPSIEFSDPAELLHGYLDAYRDTVLRKLAGLGERQARESRVPSGWSPLGLLKHLICMERRWLVWGFSAETVEQPWADHAADEDGWHLHEYDTLDTLREQLTDHRARSREIITAARLTDRARPGGRFPTERECPTLGWILLHVLQEYARHAGHLDIARELTDGTTGE